MISAEKINHPSNSNILAPFSQRLFVNYLVFVGSFICLFAISFPNKLFLLPPIYDLTAPPLIRFYSWVADYVLSTKVTFVSDLISDGYLTYIHTFFLCFISAIIALILPRYLSFASLRLLLRILFHIALYYLIYQLLNYGFNKVFKWQFPLPDVQIAHNKVGNISKDLLFWSAIGSSKSYVVFSGCLEIISAILLFVKRTRWLGSTLAVILFSNIVLINFSFDISVKLLSSVLLFNSIFVLSPFLIKLYQNTYSKLQNWISLDLNFPQSKNNTIIAFGLMAILILETSWNYFETGNFNDDKQERHILHGGYQINNNCDGITDLPNEIFISRRGQIIERWHSGLENSYPYQLDTVSKHIKLELGKSLRILPYSLKLDTFTIVIAKDTVEYIKMPYQGMKLFEPSFHWWVEP